MAAVWAFLSWPSVFEGTPSSPPHQLLPSGLAVLPELTSPGRDPGFAGDDLCEEKCAIARLMLRLLRYRAKAPILRADIFSAEPPAALPARRIGPEQ